MAHAELALRIENVAIQPDVRVGQAVAADPRVGELHEGPIDVAGHCCQHGQCPRGCPFPAWVANMPCPCERLLQDLSCAIKVIPSQLHLTAE
ncbi:MAG TPA: hypothetical protein VHJ18_18615 [Streptosporangiaceae bacterium]|nr:hypothetical protein [Streptosporangiaceae bacterium]